MASMTDVREWARANGYEVGDRGRVPQEIIDAWEAKTKQRVSPSARRTSQRSPRQPENVMVVRVTSDQAEQLLDALAPIGIEVLGSVKDYVAENL